MSEIRDDDTFLRSNPETVRQINEAIRRVEAGDGRVVTIDEVRRMLRLPRLKRLGTLRHADFRRDDDTYLRSNPAMVRIINDGLRDVREGRFVIGSLEEVEAWSKRVE